MGSNRALRELQQPLTAQPLALTPLTQHSLTSLSNLSCFLPPTHPYHTPPHTSHTPTHTYTHLHAPTHTYTPLVHTSCPQALGLTWSGLCISACGNAFAIVTSAALIARALQARGIPAEQATNAIAALLQQAAGVGAILGNILGGTLGDQFGFRATTAGIGCAYLVLPLLFAYSHPWELNVSAEEPKPTPVSRQPVSPHLVPPRPAPPRVAQSRSASLRLASPRPTSLRPIPPHLASPRPASPRFAQSSLTSCRPAPHCTTPHHAHTTPRHTTTSPSETIPRPSLHHTTITPHHPDTIPTLHHQHSHVKHTLYTAAAHSSGSRRKPHQKLCRRYPRTTITPPHPISPRPDLDHTPTRTNTHRHAPTRTGTHQHTHTLTLHTLTRYHILTTPRHAHHTHTHTPPDQGPSDLEQSASEQYDSMKQAAGPPRPPSGPYRADGAMRVD